MDHEQFLQTVVNFLSMRQDSKVMVITGKGHHIEILTNSENDRIYQRGLLAFALDIVKSITRVPTQEEIAEAQEHAEETVKALTKGEGLKN